MDDLIVELEIPLYVRDYISSESIRPKYYEKGRKEIPLKYCNKQLYDKQKIREPNGTTHVWRSFAVIRQGKKVLLDYLTEAASGKRIIANESHVGKQSKKLINGQAIYNAAASPHDRNKMMGSIKDQFRYYVKSIPPIVRFPIRITVYLFDTIMDDVYSNGQLWDVDNRFFPYGKAFSDILTQERKIPDDNIYYISEPPHAIFVPVDDIQDRKFVIRIHKDNRGVILKNYLYQRFHGNKLK